MKAMNLGDVHFVKTNIILILLLGRILTTNILNKFLNPSDTGAGSEKPNACLESRLRWRVLQQPIVMYSHGQVIPVLNAKMFGERRTGLTSRYIDFDFNLLSSCSISRVAIFQRGGQLSWILIPAIGL